MISKKLSYPKTTTISYLNLELINKNFEKEKILNSMDGKSGQIDHLFPEQIDHRFRLKLTT